MRPQWIWFPPILNYTSGPLSHLQMRRSDDTPWTSGTHPKCTVLSPLHTLQYAPLQFPWSTQRPGCLWSSYNHIFWLMFTCYFLSPVLSLPWVRAVERWPLCTCECLCLKPFSTWICCWFQGTSGELHRLPRLFPPLRYRTLPLDLCTLHKCDQTLNVCCHSSTPHGLGGCVKQKGGVVYSRK